MDNKPIGIFDSGIGGLTVLKELIKILPDEDFIYFGDTARVPYGGKSPELIREYSEEITSFFQKKNVKIVVDACFTSSSIALEHIRNKFKSLDIVGVTEYGARSASVVTENNNIGVIGTKTTIKSGAFQKVLQEINSKINVFSEPCPLFVPFIEEGFVEGDFITQIIHHYLDTFLDKNIDTLLLGCTHYPIIKKAIGKTFKDSFKIVDCGKETAIAVRNILSREKRLRKKSSGKKLTFYVSDDTESFVQNASLFLGQKIKTASLMFPWE
ncbi:glutamate racemase [bacterium]|nr:glutamate racemase [bacterium]